MDRIIQIRRGEKANLNNVDSVNGELRWTTDTKELYIGQDGAQIKIAQSAAVTDSDITIGAGYTLDVSAGTLVLADDQLETSWIGAGALPSDVTVNNANWSGTDLSVANGGTGASTLTDHGLLVGSGTDAITPMSVGTTGQLVKGATGADPAWSTTVLTETTNTFNIANGTASLDIAAGKALDINDNLTVTAGQGITLAAEDAAGSITLDNTTLEVENTNATQRAVKIVVGTDAAATLTVEGANGVINQDVTSDASPTFVTLTASTSVVADTISEKTGDAGVTIDGITLKDGGALDITGGTNTFNLTNGTAILDVAAGATVNVDKSLTVNGSYGSTIASEGQANTLTLNEGLTVGNGYSGTLTYSATGKTLTVEDNSTINQDVTSDASPTFTAVNATTFDTNVAAAGVTLAGTTLAADGTDSNIDISITPKGTGEVNLPKVDIDGGAIDGTTIGANTAAAVTVTTLTTTGSIELGHASDTTLARVSAGVVSIEGKNIYVAGGTDVAVEDGGTGRSTGTTAYSLIATGTTATGAQQTLASGATTEVLVGGGASALPVWTTATGSGAPMRAESPVITGTLGINVTSPAGPLHVATEGTASTIFDCYNNGSVNSIMFRTARGTQASPTAVTSTLLLGALFARGYSTDGTPGFNAGNRAIVGMYAAEDHTSTAQGTYITLGTTPIGSTTRAERVRVSDAGNVGIGVTNPGSILQIAGILTPEASGTRDIGTSSLLFHEIFAAHDVINTSDEREKENIQDTDLGLEFIEKLRPVRYKWKSHTPIMEKVPIVGPDNKPIMETVTELDDEGNEVEKQQIKTVEMQALDADGNPRYMHVHVRTHYGLIAQEVGAVVGDKDFGGYVHDKENDRYGLHYNEFTAVLIKAVQELSARVRQLEADAKG